MGQGLSKIGGAKLEVAIDIHVKFCGSNTSRFRDTDITDKHTHTLTNSKQNITSFGGGNKWFTG